MNKRPDVSRKCPTGTKLRITSKIQGKLTTPLEPPHTQQCGYIRRFVGINREEMQPRLKQNKTKTPVRFKNAGETFAIVHSDPCQESYAGPLFTPTGREMGRKRVNGMEHWHCFLRQARTFLEHQLHSHSVPALLTLLTSWVTSLALAGASFSSRKETTPFQCYFWRQTGSKRIPGKCQKSTEDPKTLISTRTE